MVRHWCGRGGGGSAPRTHSAQALRVSCPQSTVFLIPYHPSRDSIFGIEDDDRTGPGAVTGMPASAPPPASNFPGHHLETRESLDMVYTRYIPGIYFMIDIPGIYWYIPGICQDIFSNKVYGFILLDGYMSSIRMSDLKNETFYAWRFFLNFKLC